MKELCICKICTCGRHRCPHKKTTIGIAQDKEPRCTLTEYKSEFEGHPYQEPRHLRKPPVNTYKEPVPLDVKTTYKETYTVHQVRANITRPHREYVPSSSPMMEKSTYKRDFFKKDGSRAISYKPEEVYKRSDNKISELTMYKCGYPEFDMKDVAWCRPETMKHKECITREEGKFLGTSTVQDDYKEHKNAKRADAIRPKENNSKMDAKFDGCSSYSSQYTTKVAPAVNPVKRKTFVPTTSPFEGVSTASADYQGHPYQKREDSYKPTQKYAPSSVKFDDTTTASRAYRTWPITKRTKAKGAPQSYEISKTKFCQSSSYQDEFLPPGKPMKVKPVKPDSDRLDLFKDKDTAYQYKTHYMESFIPYKGVDRQKSYKANNEYRSPAERFAGESSYQAKYKGEQSLPAEICRPLSEHRLDNTGNQPISKDTTYALNFEEKRPKSCPIAKEIIPAKTEVGKGEIGFQQVAEKDGHQYYICVRNTGTQTPPQDK